MKRLVVSMFTVVFLAVGLVGCNDTDKSTTKTQTTISSPGGETTITTQKEIKQTGDNPPPDATIVRVDARRESFPLFGEPHMLSTILLIVLILMLLGAVPVWPYSRSWGYYPSGGLSLVVLILVVLLLAGRI